jgi:hypothetical protein
MDCCDHCYPDLQPRLVVIPRKQQDATPAHNSPASVVLSEVRNWIETEAIPSISTGRTLLASIPAEMMMASKFQNQLAHAFWYCEENKTLLWDKDENGTYKHHGILRHSGLTESLQTELVQHLERNRGQIVRTIREQRTSSTQDTTVVDEGFQSSQTRRTVDWGSTLPVAVVDTVDNIEILNDPQVFQARERNLHVQAIMRRYQSQQSDTFEFQEASTVLASQHSEMSLAISESSGNSPTGSRSSSRIRKPSEKAREAIDVDSSPPAQGKRRRDTIRRGGGRKRQQGEES